MPRLTSQLFENYSFSKHATAQTIQCGRAYQKDGHVWSTNLVKNIIATESSFFTPLTQADVKGLFE